MSISAAEPLIDALHGSMAFTAWVSLHKRAFELLLLTMSQYHQVCEYANKDV